MYEKKRQRYEKIQRLRKSSANTHQPSIDEMGRSSIGDSSHWGGADGQETRKILYEPRPANKKSEVSVRDNVSTKSPVNVRGPTASMHIGDIIMSPIESSEYVTGGRDQPTKAPDNTAVQQARLMKVEEGGEQAGADDLDDSNIPPSSSSLRDTHDPKTMNIASKIHRPVSSKSKDAMKRKKPET